jgi:hypothetical protein
MRLGLPNRGNEKNALHVGVEITLRECLVPSPQKSQALSWIPLRASSRRVE